VFAIIRAFSSKISYKKIKLLGVKITLSLKFTVRQRIEMGQSILVFVSHSFEDKEEYIEPIVQDIEDCYINV